MAEYEITDDKGRTLTIEGDTAPSEAEIDQLFAQEFPDNGGTIFDSFTNAVGDYVDQRASANNDVINYLNTGQQPGIQTAANENPIQSFLNSAQEPVREMANGVVNLASPLLSDEKQAQIGQARAQFDANQEMRREINPISTNAGTVAGYGQAIAAPGGVPTALGMGALAGAGQADIESGYGNVMGNAALGAVMGGVGEKVGSLITQKAVPYLSDVVGDKVSPFVNRLLRSPENSAKLAVKRALGGSGTTSEKLLSEYDAATASGAPVTLADLPSARAAGQGAAVMPENAARYQDQFVARQADTGARIKGNLQDITGKSRDLSKATVSNIEKERAAEAAPLYAEVLPQPVQLTQGLNSITHTPAFEKAEVKALEMLRNKHRENMPENVENTFEYWDSIKRALDDDIAGAERKGEAERLRDLVTIKSDLVNELDAQSPVYREARTKYAGKSAMLRANEIGKRFLKGDIDVLQDEIGNMNAAELDVYRLGAVQAIENEIDAINANGNMGNRLIRSQQLRDRMATLFDSQEEADQMIEQLMAERGLAATKNRLFDGSQTAQRAVANREMEEGGDFSAAVKGALSLDSRPEFREAIGDQLLSPISREQVPQFLDPVLGGNTLANKVGDYGRYLAGLSQEAIPRFARVAPYSLRDNGQ